MTEPDYDAVVNGMAQHYVDMMPGKDYQVVGRGMPVAGEDESLGVMRVNFDDMMIYSEDVDDGSAAAMKRELVASEFCDVALMNLAGYSCEATTSMPLANIEPVDELDYDLYFEDRQVMESVEAQIFFEDVFDVEEIEDEFEVEFLN